MKKCPEPSPRSLAQSSRAHDHHPPGTQSSTRFALETATADHMDKVRYPSAPQRQPRPTQAPSNKTARRTSNRRAFSTATVPRRRHGKSPVCRMPGRRVHRGKLHRHAHEQGRVDGVERRQAVQDTRLKFDPHKPSPARRRAAAVQDEHGGACGGRRATAKASNLKSRSLQDAVAHKTKDESNCKGATILNSSVEASARPLHRL